MQHVREQLQTTPTHTNYYPTNNSTLGVKRHQSPRRPECVAGDGDDALGTLLRAEAGGVVEQLVG